MNKSTREFFTEEKIKELEESIDVSDIPEINDFSDFKPKNFRTVKQAISTRIDVDNLCLLKRKGNGGFEY